MAIRSAYRWYSGFGFFAFSERLRTNALDFHFHIEFAGDLDSHHPRNRLQGFVRTFRWNQYGGAKAVARCNPTWIAGHPETGGSNGVQSLGSTPGLLTSCVQRSLFCPAGEY